MPSPLPLFPDELQTGPRPVFLCHRDPPCRPPVPLAEFTDLDPIGQSVNTGVRCLRCGRTGIISERTDLVNLRPDLPT